MRDDRGFILLTALLVLAVLSLLGTQMISLARISTQSIAQRHDNAVVEAAADGAIDRAVFDLLRSVVGREAPSLNYYVDMPGARVHIVCRELGGRINPNLASPRLFGALLLVLGADETTAGRVTAALVAARVPSAGVVRAAAAQAGALAGRFEEVASLADLPGMTPALWAAMSPHLSVFWPGTPNPALADPVVRRALAEADEMELAVATRPEESVVSIEATAMTTSGRTLIRRVVVRLGLGLDGRSWHVLAWSPSGD